MRRDHEALLRRAAPAYAQIKRPFSIRRYPQAEGKKLWALREQWKHAMVSKDRGHSVVEGDTGGIRNHIQLRPKAAKAETHERPRCAERVRAAMAEISQWSRATSEFVLKRNGECSRFHSLVDLMMNGFPASASNNRNSGRQGR